MAAGSSHLGLPRRSTPRVYLIPRSVSLYGKWCVSNVWGMGPFQKWEAVLWISFQYHTRPVRLFISNDTRFLKISHRFMFCRFFSPSLPSWHVILWYSFYSFKHFNVVKYINTLFYLVSQHCDLRNFEKRSLVGCAKESETLSGVQRSIPVKAINLTSVISPCVTVPQLWSQTPDKSARDLEYS